MDNRTPSSGFQPPSPVEGEGLDSNCPQKNSSPLAGGATHVDNSQDYIVDPSPLVGEGVRRTGEGCKKQQLRKWIKEERKTLDIKLLSKKIIKKLQKAEEYRLAKNIMIFYPLKYEIDLLELVEDKTKNFYLPKIKDNELLCCSYTKGDELCESCFKTKEPLTEAEEKSIIDLVIVPALAVDKNNYRLGYGGGFYDRFLKDLNAKKIACVSSKFFIDSVFAENHDVKIDKVITA